MKKTLFTLSIATCVSISAQKKFDNILKSTNVSDIENFLKVAHPDDSRRMILKRKMVSLKNEQWMNKGKAVSAHLKSIQPNFVNQQVAKFTSVPNVNVKVNNEEEEFRHLIAETSITHKEKTVKLLNQLFDNDVSNDKAILLIKNNGDCNMIVRIQGNEHYNLAVPARGENFLTVKKGDYKLSGNLCEARYYATKSIGKNIMVTLNRTLSESINGAKLSVNRGGVSN